MNCLGDAGENVVSSSCEHCSKMHDSVVIILFHPNKIALGFLRTYKPLFFVLLSVAADFSLTSLKKIHHTHTKHETFYRLEETRYENIPITVLTRHSFVPHELFPTIEKMYYFLLEWKQTFIFLILENEMRKNKNSCIYYSAEFGT